jgi:hypothetical protein
LAGSTASSLFTDPIWDGGSLRLRRLLTDDGSILGSALTAVSTPDISDEERKQYERVDGQHESGDRLFSIPYEALRDGPTPKGADPLTLGKLFSERRTLPARPDDTPKVIQDWWDHIKQQRMLELSPQGPRHVKSRSVEPGD